MISSPFLVCGFILDALRICRARWRFEIRNLIRMRKVAQGKRDARRAKGRQQGYDSQMIQNVFPRLEPFTAHVLGGLSRG